MDEMSDCGRKLFQVVDWPTQEELDRWFPEAKLVAYTGETQKRLRAVFAKVKRAPKAGEWYLSGALVGAYRAPNDLGTVYHLAKIVLVQERTTLQIVHTGIE